MIRLLVPALSGFVAFGLGGAEGAPQADPERHPNPDETVVEEL